MKKNNLIINPQWKIKNPQYLCAIEKFLDKASNIENTDLRNEIIYQMLECDKILTELSQEKLQQFNNYTN